MKHIKWLHRKEEEVPTNGARMLYLDIETSPNRGAVWEYYQRHPGPTMVWIDKPWHLLSFAYQWEGERKVHVFALPDFPEYRKDPEGDYDAMVELHNVMSRADIIIAHNGDNFDLRAINARFAVHGLFPTPPAATVDTLKAARKYFKFTSNRLEDLAILFKIGVKYPNHDYHLWKECLEGDPKAWARMKRYNGQDIVLLRGVYKVLRPWIRNHPRVAPLESRIACNICGSRHVTRRGERSAKTLTYQRWQCQDCGHWMRSRLAVPDVPKPLLTD